MGESVDFASNGSSASGYLALPASTPAPGVLVLQEWWGLNPQIKGVADRLAAEGFVALAPDLYHGELAEHDEMDKAAHLMSSMPIDRAARDMGGAIDFLLDHDATSGSAVGAIGFCMGGAMTLLISALQGNRVGAAVPFYGAPLGDQAPDWGGLTAPVLGHFAENDDFFPPAAINELEAQLTGMGKDVKLRVYPGTGHAFLNEDDALGTYHPEAARTAWDASVAFLRAKLLLALAVLAGACSSGDEPPKVVAAPEPACESAVDAGDARVDIGDRWYQRHVPPAPGEKPVPLLVDLHGYSEGAILHAGVTEWAAFGDDHGFVTVTPHGAGDPPQWDLALDGIDVAFVDAVITDAEDTLCVDPGRIFVTGHSMGGFLISTLACSPVAARVAAFAPVAGVRDVPECDPPRYVPALVIHGTDDDTVFFDGGLSDLAAEVLVLPADGPSIEAIVAEWDARDPDADVRLRVVEGGAHVWPADANDWIWAFFESVG